MLDAKERKPVENDNENSDEKKFLQQRIKQLELNNDVAMYKYNQQKIYEVMNVYCRLLEQEFASSPGDSMQTIIQKNAKIESVMIILGEFELINLCSRLLSISSKRSLSLKMILSL